MAQRNFSGLPSLDPGTVRLVIDNSPLFPNSPNPQTPAGLLRAWVQVTGKSHALWDGGPLNVAADALEIYSRVCRGSYQKLELPSAILERLKELLIKGPPPGRFECVSALSYLNGLPYDLKTFDLRHWNVSLLENPAELASGDSVMLVKQQGEVEEPTHFALHLGGQKFLSKWGDAGGLAVSDLNSMVVAFGADFVARLQLKEMALTRLSDSAGVIEGRRSDRAGGGRVNDLIRRRRSRLSPADTPPDFFLPDIPWKWREYEAGRYQKDLQRFRELLHQLNRLPSLKVDQFSGAHWLKVLSSLFRAFEISNSPLQALPEAEGVDSKFNTRANPRLMSERGLFKAEVGKNSGRYLPVTDFEQLCRIPPSRLRFDAGAYSDEKTWAQPLRDILNRNQNYLLLLDRKDDSVFVQLLPTTPSALAEPGMFNFYRYLAEEGIPARFHVSGPLSFKDAFLGRFDARHIVDNSVSFFPQYAPRLEAQSSLVEMEEWCVDSRHSGPEGQSVTLNGPSGTVRILRNPQGHFAVQPESERAYDLYTPPFAAFAEKLFDRTKTKMGAKVQAEKYLFLKPEEGPCSVNCRDEQVEERIRVAMHQKVKDKKGVVDHRATILYREILGELSDGGYINLTSLAERYDLIQNSSAGGRLAPDQMSALQMGLGAYVISAISRGQIGDLKGLKSVMPILSNCGLAMPPGEADKIRMYYDGLGLGAISQIHSAVSISQGGFVTFAANELMPRPQLSKDERLERDKEVTSEYDHCQLPYFQKKLFPKLVAFTQKCLPAMKVDEESVKDIIRYGQLLFVMNGWNGNLEQANMDVAIPLVALLEHSMGCKLPRLRASFNHSVRAKLEELDNEKLMQQLPGKN